jgi:DNA-damage-inducible protein D
MVNIVFENSRKLDEQYQEYWTARQLARDLEYSEYRHFLPVIEKAKTACSNSGHEVDDHFVDVDEMVILGSTAQRKIDNIRLTRYACYLVVQNADPNKQIVALGQSYFASQTRKQELIEQHDEDSKRVHLRNEMKTHNKNLASAASRAGVTDYKQFTEAGYAGLYGGMKSADIHTRK